MGINLTNTIMPLNEIFEFSFGLLIILIQAPLYLVFTILTSVWEKTDRIFQGQPRSGFFFRVCQKINIISQPIMEKYVFHKEDAYIINAILALGFFIPLLLLFNAWYTIQYGFTFSMFLAYHSIRLGPSQINFSLAQSLSHKEGHAGSDQFKSCPHLVKEFLGNAFCWLIGPLYGILPYSFKVGHTINHHKYNNSKRDTISNSDMERDSVFNFIRYLTRFFFYSTNLSLFPQFIQDKQYKLCIKLLVGMLYYTLIFAFFANKVSLLFSICYFGQPFIENVFNIAAYNWTWHAFIDPEDPTNDYANSITIIDGSYNVIDRDLHVVHHEFPGVHWSKYRAIFEKDREQYTLKKASLFQKTEPRNIFFMILFKQYDTMIEKFIFTNDLTKEQKIQFIQKRLRSITWGRNQNVFLKDSQKCDETKKQVS